MKYELYNLQVDLGTTPIENMFLNNYLALADGNTIKVYLYAYKQAYERKEVSESFAEIAENLALTEDEVMDAFGFWQEQGIVEIVSDRDDFKCKFKSLRQMFLGINIPSENEEAVSKKEVKDNSVLSNDKDTSMTNTQMYNKIEEVLGTNLLPSEIERIHKLREEFNQDRDLIVQGFIYSSDTQGKKNINYVLTVLRNWAIDGITSMEDLAVNKKEKEEKKKKVPNKKRLNTTEKKSSDDIEAALQKKLIEDFKKAQGGKTE